MNTYKATFLNGNTMKVKATSKTRAFKEASQHGSTLKVEKVESLVWLLIYPALIALGLFAFYQVA